MTTIAGLPAHVLLVHAVVVLVPLSALLVVLAAVWPTLRRRLGVVVPAVALVALVLVPVTTDAGEWLERRVPRGALVHAHTRLGDELLPWAAALFVVAAGGWLLYQWRRSPLDRASRRGRLVVRVAVAVLAVAVSVGTVVQTYRIGESGARAAWHGRVHHVTAPDRDDD